MKVHRIHFFRLGLSNIMKDGELLKIQIKSCTKTPSDDSPNNIGVPLTNGVKIHYTFENVDYYATFAFVLRLYPTVSTLFDQLPCITIIVFTTHAAIYRY